MRVIFHTYPGIELLDPKKKSEMTTGDGIYEETWLDLHAWRREVTLGDYHAIEEDSNGVRKMQASSDYEPSRVLMMLNALLDPVPRNLTSREYKHGGASGWKIDSVENRTFSLVRISAVDSNPRAKVTDAFFFLTHGILVIRNERGLITKWGDDILFGGKVVPKSLTVMAGERTLVSADVTIEPAGQIDPAIFDLPGGSAEPGETLRPLHQFEVRMPDLVFRRVWVTRGGAVPSHGNSIWEVLDRHGRYRDIELIDAVDEADAKTDMDIMRDDRHDPATIDGKPCEVQVSWEFY